MRHRGLAAEKRRTTFQHGVESVNLRMADVSRDNVSRQVAPGRRGGVGAERSRGLGHQALIPVCATPASAVAGRDGPPAGYRIGVAVGPLEPPDLVGDLAE